MLATGLRRACSRKAQAASLGLSMSHGTRLGFQLQCTINPDFSILPSLLLRVRSRTGVEVAFVAQDLPSNFG